MKLSSSDWEILFETDEESYRTGNFKRIFPVDNNEKLLEYDKYFEYPRYKNILV